MTDLLLVEVYAAAFVLVILLPWLYDIEEAYRERRALVRALFGQAKPGGEFMTMLLSGAKEGKLPEELDILIQDLRESPAGISGLGRLVMTMGVLAVIALATIQLMLSVTLPPTVPATIPATSPAYNQTLVYIQQTTTTELDIVKSLITILGGAVSAMIGFYFGARSKETPQDPRKNPKPS